MHPPLPLILLTTLLFPLLTHASSSNDQFTPAATSTSLSPSSSHTAMTDQPTPSPPSSDSKKKSKSKSQSKKLVPVAAVPIERASHDAQMGDEPVVDPGLVWFNAEEYRAMLEKGRVQGDGEGAKGVEVEEL